MLLMPGVKLNKVSVAKVWQVCVDSAGESRPSGVAALGIVTVLYF